MLGTLLEKLGTLLPRNFIIANFFPMLLFAAMNGMMLYWVSDRFHETVHNYLAMNAGEQTLIGFPILIAITLAAYIFSTLNLLQLEILEGQYGPDSLKEALAAGQQRRADRSNSEFELKKKYRRAFKRLNGVQRLRTARDEGNKQQSASQCAYFETSDIAELIKNLELRRARYQVIRPDEFETVLRNLEEQLRSCAVDKRDPGMPDLANKTLLNNHQEIFIRCLEYAEKRNENEYVALFNRREFNYSSFKLAPTAMGNIGESVRGYARSRYAINLDAFWSRLQKILIEDEKFYSTLVDAKTQLDFMISLFWVTVSFTIIWTIELIYLRRSLTAFLIVAIGGPLLSCLWYKIALQNYRAFADICRTSVDLYRFQLLHLLHVERPLGSRHERKIWTEVNKLIGYGEEQLIIYRHPPPPKS